MKNLTIFSLVIVVLFSCKKSDRDEDSTTNSSSDYATTQSMAYDVFKLVHQAALSSKGITANNLADTTSLFGCDTLIVDTASNPMKIDIRFNGTCNDRSGVINATFNTKYDAYGCTVNINFINFKYLDNSISGNISYNFTGLVNSIPTYSYTIHYFQYKSISFKGNQTIEIHGGETTAAFSDDTYMIRGTGSGVASVGNEFTTSIATDLTLLGSCQWISGGIVNVSPENKPTRTLDFGSGCDNNATVKIYDINYDITF